MCSPNPSQSHGNQGRLPCHLEDPGADIKETFCKSLTDASALFKTLKAPGSFLSPSFT